MMSTNTDILLAPIRAAMENRGPSELARSTGLSRFLLYRIRTEGRHAREVCRYLRLMSELGIDAGAVQRLMCQNGTTKDETAA